MSTLVLAPDYQPVTFLPLSTVGWETAVKLHFLDKVNVIEWYEDWTIHSAKMEMKVPAVVVVKSNFKRRRLGPMRFTKHNLYLRDLFTCQYCLETFPTSELTIDHVVPYSKGGKTSWENCVAAGEEEPKGPRGPWGPRGGTKWTRGSQGEAKQPRLGSPG